MSRSSPWLHVVSQRYLSPSLYASVCMNVSLKKYDTKSVKSFEKLKSEHDKLLLSDFCVIIITFHSSLISLSTVLILLHFYFVLINQFLQFQVINTFFAGSKNNHSSSSIEPVKLTQPGFILFVKTLLSLTMCNSEFKIGHVKIIAVKVLNIYLNNILYIYVI